MDSMDSKDTIQWNHLGQVSDFRAIVCQSNVSYEMRGIQIKVKNVSARACQLEANPIREVKKRTITQFYVPAPLVDI